MVLFTKDKKLEFEVIPSTPQQDKARNFLEDLSQRDLDFPERGVAGLSANEQTIQDQLSRWLTASSDTFDQATGYYSDVLSDQYDPETSRYYKGIREQLETGREEAEAGVRRTAQKAGSARSTPFLGVEAKTGAAYRAKESEVLGGLLQDERRFKSEAASKLTSAGGQRISQLGAAEDLAAVPRSIEQMQLDAAYQKILQDLTAPYTYQAQIASQILNEPRFAGIQTGGGLTDLGFAASVAGSAMTGGIFGGIGSIFGGGSSGSGGGSGSSGNSGGGGGGGGTKAKSKSKTNQEKLELRA